MSDKNKPTTESEEVDLGQFFKVIGNILEKAFVFLKMVFLAIFSVFIAISAAVIKYWKIIAIVLVLGYTAGKLLEVTKPPIYVSKMVVRPYFDSKFELITNVNYYDALLQSQNYKELSQIFEIHEDTLAQLKSFNIKPGPESENDRILEYEEFLTQIDSTRAQTLTFENYKENRSVYSGNLFEVIIKSGKSDIFKDLEEGFKGTFKNDYSKRLKEKNDSIYNIERRKINKSLAEVKELQKTYIKLLENQNEEAGSSVKFGEGLTISTVDGKKTREFDLVAQELTLRNQLSELDKEQIEKRDFYDIVSGFQQVGNPTSSFIDKLSMVIPLLGLLFLILVFLLSKFVNYVKNYDA